MIFDDDGVDEEAKSLFLLADGLLLLTTYSQGTFLSTASRVIITVDTFEPGVSYIGSKSTFSYNERNELTLHIPSEIITVARNL